MLAAESVRLDPTENLQKPTRKVRRNPIVVKQAVAILADRGLTKTEIGQQVGITRQTAAKYLSELQRSELIDYGRDKLSEAIPHSASLIAEKSKTDVNVAQFVIKATGVARPDFQVGIGLAFSPSDLPADWRKRYEEVESIEVSEGEDNATSD